MISKALSKLAGWEIETARSGIEALSILQKRRPDLVLLDVSMPEMDGLQMVERLRLEEDRQDEHSRLPIILITARVQQHEMLRYQKLAIAGVISKPFDPLQLPKQIQALMPAPINGSEEREHD